MDTALDPKFAEALHYVFVVIHSATGSEHHAAAWLAMTNTFLRMTSGELEEVLALFDMGDVDEEAKLAAVCRNWVMCHEPS